MGLNGPTAPIRLFHPRLRFGLLKEVREARKTLTLESTLPRRSIKSRRRHHHPLALSRGVELLVTGSLSVGGSVFEEGK
ncbi:hypothetical protein NL676_023031 [Syzygium grande]|nr:hypothetical protein NL676_023031 [Syzygium grande]